MAVPFTQDQSTFLDNFGTRLANAAKRADGIIKVLLAKKAVEEETSGGENFLERVMYGVNQNVGWRGATTQIPTLPDDAITMAKVPQKIISGTIVLNSVRLDRAKKQGEWAIGQLIEDCKKIAEVGYVQKWSDSFRADNPAANEPFTLLPSSNANSANGILAPTAPASQTATTAGISRADNSWWRNQYSNTSMDISAEAGRATLHSSLYLNCVFGASIDDEPDFGLTSGAVLADLGAAVDSNRRGDYESKFLAQLGLNGIVFHNAALVRDSSTKFANKIALINTRDLKIKYLSSDSMNKSPKETWDQENELGGIPVNMGQWMNDIDSLNWIAKFYAVASLVPCQLRTHGLADNVV